MDSAPTGMDAILPRCILTGETGPPMEERDDVAAERIASQVVADGQVVDDRRGCVDWFVKREGEWRIQAAVDLPAPSSD